jgi:hypothetical protein
VCGRTGPKKLGQEVAQHNPGYAKGQTRKLKEMFCQSIGIGRARIRPSGAARNCDPDGTNLFPEPAAMRPKAILVSESDGRGASFAFEVWTLVREETVRCG